MDCVYSLWYNAPMILPAGNLDEEAIGICHTSYADCLLASNLVGCLYYHISDARSHKHQIKFYCLDPALYRATEISTLLAFLTMFLVYSYFRKQKYKLCQHNEQFNHKISWILKTFDTKLLDYAVTWTNIIFYILPLHIFTLTSNCTNFWNLSMTWCCMYSLRLLVMAGETVRNMYSVVPK
jgi:hypothetical protein